MPSSQLTVIGCGVFGRSIVQGLSAEVRQTYRLALTHRRADAARELAGAFPDALVTCNNQDARIWAPADGPAWERHVVLVATQPEYTSTVCDEVRRACKLSPAACRPLVVTVCPGITVAQLEAWLPAETPVIRTMPNTPVVVRQGATALFPNHATTPAMLAEIRAVFEGMSPTTVVLPDEGMLDIVASISGSAPAYVFHLMQSLVAAGVARGLPAALARELVVQTCRGSAALAQQQSDATLLELLADVCVSGGSTEKAISQLDAHGVAQAVDAAVGASWHANRAMGATPPAKSG